MLPLRYSISPASIASPTLRISYSFLFFGISKAMISSQRPNLTSKWARTPKKDSSQSAIFGDSIARSSSGRKKGRIDDHISVISADSGSVGSYTCAGLDLSDCLLLAQHIPVSSTFPSNECRSAIEQDVPKLREELPCVDVPQGPRCQDHERLSVQASNIKVVLIGSVDFLHRVHVSHVPRLVTVGRSLLRITSDEGFDESFFHRRRIVRCPSIPSHIPDLGGIFGADLATVSSKVEITISGFGMRRNVLLLQTARSSTTSQPASSLLLDTFLLTTAFNSIYLLLGAHDRSNDMNLPDLTCETNTCKKRDRSTVVNLVLTQLQPFTIQDRFSLGPRTDLPE
ncbi:hypothetical protein KCU90_g207, partial [Aureobasidium melanogenum]